MNWLLIIVVLVLAFGVIRGYQRGFLRMMYAMVSWVIMLVLVTWATPYINTYIREHTPIYEKIENYCEREIREKTVEKAEEKAQETAGTLTEEVQKAADEQSSKLSGLGMNLPGSVVKNISQKTAETAGEILDESGVYARVSEGMADFILNGISFFIALAVAIILLHIISQVLGLVSMIPIIHGINKYLGMAAGALYGFVIVWIVFYIIALCSTSEIGTALISYIYESPFLTYIYEHNLIITLVLIFL